MTAAGSGTPSWRSFSTVEMARLPPAESPLVMMSAGLKPRSSNSL